MTTTLIKNAEVIDGTGRKPDARDVIIEGDTIASLQRPGSCGGQSFDHVIDGKGSYLCPGFIESHAHSDNSPLLSFDDTSKILQGVTTEVVGNCGFSLAPIAEAFEQEFYDLVTRIFPREKYPWKDYSQFRAAIEQFEPITNYAALVGHNTIRIAVRGLDPTPPSPLEMLEMQRLVGEAMEEGAVGLSSGLIYPPGVFSQPDELNQLVSVLPRGAVYSSHMRNESYNLVASINETLAAVAGNPVHCHISHLKFADRFSSSLMDEAVTLLDAHRTAGVALTQDIYPYTAASTMLSALLPPWMHEGGSRLLLQRLRDPETLRRAVEEVNNDRFSYENYAMAAGWEGIVIASSHSHRFDGMNLLEIAHQLSTAPGLALGKILVEENLEATMIVHAMREEDVVTALRSPFTAIGSDGLPLGTGGKPHPRAYGTFARILDFYVRDKAILSLQEAIRRMTSLPAGIFGLQDRGSIEVGKKADLVIFDTAGVTDHATFQDPTNGPTGINSVFVNGVKVVENDRWLERRAGRFVRARH